MKYLMKYLIIYLIIVSVTFITLSIYSYIKVNRKNKEILSVVDEETEEYVIYRIDFLRIFITSVTSPISLIYFLIKEIID